MKTKPIKKPASDKSTAAAGATTQPRPHYVRAKEAAQYLGISISTLWHWAKTRAGFPRPIKAGERVTLFDLVAIDAWLQEQRQGAAA